MGPALLRGSCEGGKVPTHEEAPSLAETEGGQRGSFGATEVSTTTGVQSTKQRGSLCCTEDRCQPALSSLRGFSAHQPVQVGAGS